ncbi:sensor domain-containing diguanylate cyclase [Actinoplanes sp. LDG1-01]|uniref:Sensor domain-containing diguanylate cyclase n=2 Tax=Paractinoplanes lichenicola TaxID=2802976 RepID=A0ABS1VEH3_9ACTN|nr:sensor domain-containing diguanylate cyclase [Actinoplanes lichenicola]
MLPASLMSVVHVSLTGASWFAAVVGGGVLTMVVLVRFLEYRLGRLAPIVVDLLELAAFSVAIVVVGNLDPVLGPIYFLLFFRAVSGSLRRLVPMIVGYMVVSIVVPLVAGIGVQPGATGGMLVGFLVYGMQVLLRRIEAQSRERAELLLRLPSPVIVVGDDGEIILSNPAAAALTGPLEQLRAYGGDGAPVDLRRLPAGSAGLELRLVRGDGTVARALAETVRVENGTIVGLADVTAQRDYEERLQRAAFHDALTGLPNRALLWQRFETAGESYGVLLIDLDGFKAINDTLGHQAGDDLLRGVAERVSGVCGPDATVARLGGDEFAVLLPGAGVAEAERTAEAVRSCFGEEFMVDGGPARAGGSIGCAVAAPGQSPDEVLAAADAAMYRTKRAIRRPAAA